MKKSDLPENAKEAYNKLLKFADDLKVKFGVLASGVVGDISKVSSHIKSALKVKGYTDADILELIKINYLASKGKATANQIVKARKIAEKCFSMPTKNTKMRKVISLEALNEYHLGVNNVSTYNKSVGGFVLKAEDMAIENAEQVYRDLCLGYPNSEFAPTKGFATIEYDNVGEVVRPYNSKKASGFDLPQTKTGMLGSENKILPEFHIEDFTKIEEGAILRVFSPNTSKPTEIYRLKSNKWEVVK